MSLAVIERRYNPVAKTFHWLIVLLIVMQYCTELVLPYFLPKAMQDGLVAWHLSLGPTILLITLLRLVWRLKHPPPAPPGDLPMVLRLISRVTHWLFYVMLILLPVLGWVAASAYGAKVYLFGVVPLPSIAAKNDAFGESMGGIHGTVALSLLALIALHVAGALYHGLVKRDGVMQRMLPD